MHSSVSLELVMLHAMLFKPVYITTSFRFVLHAIVQFGILNFSLFVIEALRHILEPFARVSSRLWLIYFESKGIRFSHTLIVHYLWCCATLK